MGRPADGELDNQNVVESIHGGGTSGFRRSARPRSPGSPGLSRLLLLVFRKRGGIGEGFGSGTLGVVNEIVFFLYETDILKAVEYHSLYFLGHLGDEGQAWNSASPCLHNGDAQKACF